MKRRYLNQVFWEDEPLHSSLLFEAVERGE